MDKKTPSRGGIELRAYLDRVGLTIPEFCEKHGLERVQVQRIVNGERGHNLSTAWAKKIHDATDGEVPWDVWASDDESTDAPTAPPAATGTKG
jgi:plasmid maintenance system antidote protein VapI